ncbi:hypothetical protein K474DRAFT_1294658 [Panus rudis PR-1116 ss-1]|nr:hypothetical protein K474DRAFT_1294658 [Panus rudis PR-1116 ss-1]
MASTSTTLCVNFSAGICKAQGPKGKAVKVTATRKPPTANTACSWALCKQCCLHAAREARKGCVARGQCRVFHHRPGDTPVVPVIPVPSHTPTTVIANDSLASPDTIPSSLTSSAAYNLAGPSSSAVSSQAQAVPLPPVEINEPGFTATVDAVYRAGYAVPIANPWQSIPSDALTGVVDRSASADLRKRQVTEAKMAKKTGDRIITVMFWYMAGQPPLRMHVATLNYPLLHLDKLSAISTALKAQTSFDHTHVQVFQAHIEGVAGGDPGWFVCALNDPVRLARGQRSCFVRAWTIHSESALQDRHCDGFDDSLRRQCGFLCVADGRYVLSPKRSASPTALSPSPYPKRQRVASAPAQTPERVLSPEPELAQPMSSPGPMVHDTQFSTFRTPGRPFRSLKPW